MNITAAMIALRVDLDRAAKHALLVICCHADYPAGRAELSLRDLAAGMGASLNTAVEASRRAVEAGYLAVDKSPGRITIWRLTVAATDTPTVAATDTDCRGGRDTLIGSLDKSRSGVAARQPVENPGRRGRYFMPGSGWIEDFTNGGGGHG